MTNEEINKTIAEYMGYKDIKLYGKFIREQDGLLIGNTYTESLDALVPVWEKLGLVPISCSSSGKIWVIETCFQTITLDAAKATVKAIGALNEN